MAEAEKQQQAAQQARSTTRKVKDKWRSKAWFSVMAPDMFNRAKIAETMADTPEGLVGRVAEVTVQELTGDFMRAHIKMSFRIRTIIGTEAHTDFVGHELTSDYIRRMTRRKRTKTDMAIDVPLKDGFILRVKPMAITEKRIQSAQQTVIRNIMCNLLATRGQNSTIDEFVKLMISGDLAKELSRSAKPIQPMLRVEIRKSEVVKVGILPEIKPLPGEQPAAEAAPAPSPIETPAEPSAEPAPEPEPKAE